MTNKPKSKCYAIHYIDNNENKIIKTWAECSKLIKGRSNKYHGFANEKDAKEWLNSFSTGTTLNNNGKQYKKAP